MLRPRVGIRTRILAIALIPSVALFTIGLGAAGYLLRQSQHVKTWSSIIANGSLQTRDMIAAVHQERLLSLVQLTSPRSKPAGLGQARQRLDAALRELSAFEADLNRTGIASIDSATGGFDAFKSQLPTVRDNVDAGTLPIADAYKAYSGMLEGVALGIELVGKSAPDSRVAFEFANLVRVLRASEAMSRSSVLGVVILAGTDLSDELMAEYRNLVGYYHADVVQLASDLGDQRGKSVETLLSAPDWQRISEMDDFIAHRLTTDRAGSAQTPPIPVAAWRGDIDLVHGKLLAIWQAQNDHGSEVAGDYATQTSRYSLLAGSGVLLLAAFAFCASIWLANRLARRLQRLRTETIALAEERLPGTISRLDQGQSIDLEAEGSQLAFGHDEVGEVAKAFNQAHAAAIAAAAAEARTREGVRAVIVNIAHRSQLVVHRQLEILDEAERRQEDPSLLDTFFKLDHLATRERRNAENLVILGGGQPGRQWRRPVPLIDLARSAVGETLDYSRVRTVYMPQVSIAGAIVADLIHLIAELIDNATHFSPPQSPVKVTGQLVGKGVAVEVADQGMGMQAAHIARANDLLRHPPDFGFLALSDDPRLGLFVVAKLAIRHGISVRLTESDYGGIRAIVLIPNVLVAAPNPADEQFSLLPERIPHAAPRGGLPTAPADASVVGTQDPLSTTVNSLQPLPRRRRQANLAPELAAESGRTATEYPPVTPPPLWSPEEARDLFSAIEDGTTRGRIAQSDGQGEAATGPTTGQF